ncbi:MAG: YitT family protein [Lachnospiraceae bacterium]|nr:YitT family protein [Lachnospiraceae bacterium]
MKKSRFHVVMRVPMLVIACVIFSINIKTFVRTGGLIPGGVMGVSLLIQEIVERFFGITIPYSPINIALNAIPVYIGFKYIGKRFTALSCFVIVLSSLLTDLIPANLVTEEMILITIFGGILNGVATSICLLADATSGGTDFISIFLSRKKGIDGFNVILCVNAMVLVIAGIVFDWDKALYSIVFQYVSTAVIHLLYRKYQQSTLLIVTSKADEICSMIYDMTGHGSTIIYGKGSYEKESDKSVVYSVVSAAEVHKVMNAIKEKDPESFVNEFKSERIGGKFYRIPEE